jgi:LysM repeat protein
MIKEGAMKSRRSLCALIVAALLLSVSASAVQGAPVTSTVPAQDLAHPSSSCYTVQPGDNLYRISLRLGVSMYALMQANGLSNPNHVYVGQVLCIGNTAPPPAPPPAPWPAPRPAPRPAPLACGFHYTVAYGDTLGTIAARFGTTAYAIMQRNGLSNPNFVYPGQVLCIPVPYIPPPPSTGGTWRGEYYSNNQLAGAPSVVRYDSAINFDWGLGWPHPQICADNFSVRWTRKLWLNTGTWRFTTTTDDGARLYVDDVLVIDQWQQQPATTYTADVPLSAGYHTVRMEYFELTGTALAHLSWGLVGGFGPCPTPGFPTASPCAPTGTWFGEYYNNMFLAGGPTFTRTDAAVDFDWGRTTPPGPGVDKYLWSARWTGTVYLTGGTYRFHVIVDDGVRVFVDGRVVIDEWEDNPGVEFMGDKHLSTGNHEIKVEFYQKGYDAKIKLWWEKLN